MAQFPANGTRDVIDGTPVVWYDGYWIRYYPPPVDSLTEKKRLIEQLTKRAFHQTEDGINTPGERLDLARQCYEAETDPARKRVNAAMLAGALFNRATDIFTNVVDLAAKGVEIPNNNELMQQCAECFKEALELGKNVKHYSGEEGLDEIWGEPFKAFTMPIAAFHESRYIKVARAMGEIDRLAAKMRAVADHVPGFAAVDEQIVAFAAAARRVSETMKTDRVIFQLWPQFVAAGEALYDFLPACPDYADDQLLAYMESARRLLREGKRVIEYLAGARVPMPKTTAAYLEKCDLLLALPVPG